MDNASTERKFRTLLAAIEELQRRELDVLRKLNRDELDAITAQKTRLIEQLKEWPTDFTPSAEDIQAIRRIRKALIFNQVLTLHARDTTRNILEIAGVPVPDSTPGFPRQRKHEGGFKVDFRG